MGLIGDVALWSKLGLPNKDSAAYKLAGLSGVEGKINRLIIDPNSGGNRLIFKDKNNNLLFMYDYDDETKEIRIHRPMKGGDYCTMLDKDGDGNYDSVFVYRKSSNTRFDLCSTKDDGHYDEIYYNYNEEKDANGLLIYHKM